MFAPSIFCLRIPFCRAGSMGWYCSEWSRRSKMTAADKPPHPVQQEQRLRLSPVCFHSLQQITLLRRHLQGANAVTIRGLCPGHELVVFASSTLQSSRT